MRLLKEEAGRCINCGFCEAVCPTFPSSGYDGSKGARGRVMLGKELSAAAEGSGSISPYSDSFYSCLDCYACLQVCPAGVNAGKVSHLAKEIMVERSEGIPPLAKLVEQTIMRYHSVLPLGKRASEWAEGLDIPDGCDTLLYTGQMYQLMSYSSALMRFINGRGRFARRITVEGGIRLPWLMKIALLFNDRELCAEMNSHLKNIASLLLMNGIRFSYMGGQEPYPGTLLHDLGFISSMRKYASLVADEFRRRGARRIITVDPHTHDLLKNTYPLLVKGFDLEVVHYTELLDTRKFRRKGEAVSFHEPCHLTRRFESMTAPSELLNAVSSVRLPDYSGKRTHCCGGPDEMLYPEISKRVSLSRISQLHEGGGPTTVVACPVCLLNLRGGGGLKDLSSILMDCIAADDGGT